MDFRLIAGASSLAAMTIICGCALVSGLRHGRVRLKGHFYSRKDNAFDYWSAICGFAVGALGPVVLVGYMLWVAFRRF